MDQLLNSVFASVAILVQACELGTCLVTHVFLVLATSYIIVSRGMAQSKPAVTPLQVNGKNVPWLQWKTEKDYSFWKCLLCNRSKGGKWIDALTKADLKNCKHMTSQEHIKNQATWFQMECGQGEMKWGHMICYLPEEDFEHYPSEWINFELKQVGLLQLDPPSSSPAASSASAEESPDPRAATTSKP